MKTIKEEFKKINKNLTIQSLGYTIGLFDDDNIFVWKISIIGPKDTSYADGLFFLKIIFPEDFPDKPPDVIFLTPIYHLNVNPLIPKFLPGESLGHACFSVTNWWKPKTSIEELFIKLYSVFYLADDSLYGFERVEEYRNNRTLFEKKIKYFTNKYANPLLKGQKDYSDKDWDFSISDEEMKCLDKESNYIDIRFNINGLKKIVKCDSKDLTKVAIKKLNIEPNIEDRNLLVIYRNRKIDLNKSLKDNEIKNDSTVIIIYDVYYA